MEKLKLKIAKYFKRYFIAEISGTTMAIACSMIAFRISESNVAAVIAGTWGENIGFYGAIISRDVFHSKKQHSLKKEKYKLKGFGKNIRNIFLEFGTSEILDSFVIRPSTMYFFTTIVGNLQIGILIGKIIADIIFYIPAIIFYELREKYLKD